MAEAKVVVMREEGGGAEITMEGKEAEVQSMKGRKPSGARLRRVDSFDLEADRIPGSPASSSKVVIL